MTALIDVHHLGLHQTGNETWARNVARQLEIDGADRVHFAVSAAGMGELPDSVGPERRHVVGANSVRRLALDLPRLIHSLKPSALLVQYTLPLVRTPGVVVVHDLSFESPQAAQFLPLRTRMRYRATIRSSVRRASAVVVPTDWTRREMEQHYGVSRDRCFLAYPALDPALGLALTAESRVTDPTAPVVLCVGQVLPRKNLPVVARAVRAIRLSGVPATLRIVGHVPSAGLSIREELLEILGPAVEFAGAVTSSELVAAYRSADVFCFPSRFEGFGFPLLEAMAAQVPVVSSDATCLPEVAGDAAILVDPDDEGAWADAIGRLLADPSARASAVERGLARLEAFSWVRTAEGVRSALDRTA